MAFSKITQVLIISQSEINSILVPKTKLGIRGIQFLSGEKTWAAGCEERSKPTCNAVPADSGAKASSTRVFY